MLQALRRRYWDYRARGWQRRMRTRRRKRYVAERADWLAEHAPSGAVLDLGCGTGSYAKALVRRGFEVTGVDFSDAMLKRARTEVPSARAAFVAADINDRLPFPGATFDAVLSVLSFDHVADARAVLREVRRVLKPGGVLLVVTLSRARRNRERRMAGAVERVRRTVMQQVARSLVSTYSRDEFLRIASAAGFSLVDERATDKTLLQVVLRAGG